MSNLQSSLTNQIDYRFAGHLQQQDEKGRLLAWEGAIRGHITGNMKWWVVMPPPVSESLFAGGSIGYYSARWEIRNGEKLLLAGETAGKTVFAHGADGIWDGQGVVTEASEELKALKGRRVYETGPVIAGSTPPESYSGTGLFAVF